MKLTTNNAIAIVNTLAGMKLSRIADTEVRTNLVWDYVELRRVSKAADDRRAEIVKKFQEDWADEIDDVRNLRADNKPVIGHDSFLESERDANELIAAIYNEDVEVSIRPVGMDQLVGAISGDDITFEQVAFLADNGIVK